MRKLYYVTWGTGYKSKILTEGSIEKYLAEHFEVEDYETISYHIEDIEGCGVAFTKEEAVEKFMEECELFALDIDDSTVSSLFFDKFVLEDEYYRMLYSFLFTQKLDLNV